MCSFPTAIVSRPNQVARVQPCECGSQLAARTDRADAEPRGVADDTEAAVLEKDVNAGCRRAGTRGRSTFSPTASSSHCGSLGSRTPDATSTMSAATDTAPTAASDAYSPLFAA